jgi:hypothetical protein
MTILELPRGGCLLVLTIVIPVLATMSAPTPLPAQAPHPTITGPIPSAPQGDPSGNATLNPSAIALAAHGYVEEEYFIEGHANRYSTPELQTGGVQEGGHPYRTRFTVRRPVSPERFNGVVVIEWNNVTGARDLDIDWWQSGAHLAREGYAFIALSAQRVGVEHLKATRPARYGSLDVTAGGAITNDALSYDILTAVAQAVPRVGEPPPAGTDILGGLRANVLIATGHSQSAGRLTTYANSVHPLAPAFDGFMIHGGGGRIRDDQPVRIFKVMAETDMAGRAANPQPNTDRFRQWEVAGSSHVDLPFEIEYAKMRALEAGEPTDRVAPRTPTCELPAFSHVPFRHAMNAAFEHLRVWIADGTSPPEAPPLRLVQAGPPVEFARDDQGNVLGGIRLATHAVPTARNTGMNTGHAFCRLYGSHEPFDEATLRRLYPTHEAYVAAVREVVRENLAAGYILEHDAEETIREAERSSVGRW